MTPPREQQAPPAARDLMAAFEARLGTAMGVRLTALERLVGSGPVALGLAWLIAFGSVAGLVIWWSNEGPMQADGHAKLASILLWNAFHFPVLVAIARFGTVRVLDIVRRDILPYASDDYAASVKQTLDEQHASRLFRLTPWAVAAIATVASVWAIRAEIAPVWWTASRFPMDLLFWSVAVAVLSYLMMRVVVAATFPRLFAAALERERQSLYPPCAAKSALVEGLARLNRTMLGYWAVSFVVLATVALLPLLPEPYRLAGRYLFVVMPLLGVFSLGVGALVYLDSESTIASALKRYSLERAEALQREITALMNSGADADEKTAARLDRLTRLHDQIVAGGNYGSRVGAAVSILLPLLPAIGLIEKLFFSSNATDAAAPINSQ